MILWELLQQDRTLVQGLFDRLGRAIAAGETSVYERLLAQLSEEVEVQIEARNRILYLVYDGFPEMRRHAKISSGKADTIIDAFLLVRDLSPDDDSWAIEVKNLLDMVTEFFSDEEATIPLISSLVSNEDAERYAKNYHVEKENVRAEIQEEEEE